MVTIENVEHPAIFPFILVNTIFLLAGIFMRIFPPKKINGLYGYRTSKSMKNQVNWEIAQTQSAILMIKHSLMALVFTLLFFALPIPLGWSATAAGMISLYLLIMMFVKTERSLK
jgi:uncharacterized membrane protein